MLGYILWTTDQLAGLSRGGAGVGSGPAEPGRIATARQQMTRVLSVARRARRCAAGAPLAPRFAACYKIAMSIAMGYMLIMML